MALSVPTSWTDYDMNWEDPDPFNPVYYYAIAEAISERVSILLYKDDGLASSPYMYDKVVVPVYKMFESKSIINSFSLHRILYSFAESIIFLSSTAIIRDSFFNSLQIIQQKPLFLTPQIAAFNIYGHSMQCQPIKELLKIFKKSLDLLTLYPMKSLGNIGTINVQGGGSSGRTEPSYYPGTAPPYDFMPFSEMYEESSSIGENIYKQSLSDAMKAATSSKGFTDGEITVQFRYYLRRENNFPWAHSHMEWERRGGVLFNNTKFEPTIHCVVSSTDDSYDTVSENGITNVNVDSTGGFAPYTSKTPYLIKDYMTSFIGVTEFESNPPESYPIKDVDVPLAGTKGWQTYECGGKDDVTFFVDFNCEGGFKFRPDSK